MNHPSFALRERDRRVEALKARRLAGVSVIVNRLHSGKPFIAVLSVFYPMFDHIYPDTIDIHRQNCLRINNGYE